MQTLNILDNSFSEFQAYRVMSSDHVNKNIKGLALLEQLQTTLELDEVINKFAMEASKYIDFTGLQFTNGKIASIMRGSRKGQHKRKFELKINNEFVGVLTYDLNRAINSITDKVLQQLHQYLIYPLRNAIKYSQALQLAMQDGLTHLGNRRHFDEQLKRAMNHALRQHSLIGLVFYDLNKFKSVNDTYGHHVGDRVLVQFANALKESIRESDSAFRFGGDEFAVLIENASKESLAVIKARVEKAVSEDTLLAKYQISASFGATFMQRNDNERSFYERTDQALYRNKVHMPRSLSVI